MLVVVQGDPLALSTSLTGLDILAARHPKLHALLLDRLDFTLGPDGQVGLVISPHRTSPLISLSPHRTSPLTSPTPLLTSPTQG